MRGGGFGGRSVRASGGFGGARSGGFGGRSSSGSRSGGSFRNTGRAASASRRSSIFGGRSSAGVSGHIGRRPGTSSAGLSVHHGHRSYGRPQYHRRGIFYRRYYPHSHYYHINGYRGAHYGASTGGVFVFLGILLTVYDVIVHTSSGESLFNSLFIVGLMLLGLGVLISINMNARLARLRSQNPESDSQNYYSEDSAPSPVVSASSVSAPVSPTPAPSSSLDGYVTGAAPAPASKTGRCPSCGASGSGEFCTFCGTKMS